MASTLPESARPEAVALVLWQGEDFLQVTVRVGRGGAQWVARSLAFSERDSISERWTTVGLTIATLVGETRRLGASPPAATVPPVASPPPPTTAEPPKVATPPADRAPRQRERPFATWATGVGFLAGSGWDGGGWQQGGWIALSVRLGALPIQAHVFGSYAQSDGPPVAQRDLSTTWLTAGAGAGVYGRFRPLSLLGSAELELGYRRVQVDFNDHHLADQEVPVRLRAGVSVPADGIIAGVLGAAIRIPPQNTTGSSSFVMRAAPVAFEGLLGLEVRL